MLDVHTPFVGRTTEMQQLVAAFERTCAGQGGVVLLTGEPGIGKTRMAEELAAQAVQQGMLVLWGRCYEGGSAPAFWPWVQILRAYLRTHDLSALLADSPGHATNLARLLPELGARAPAIAPLPTDEEQARFYLFHSVTTLLLRAAQAQPLLLILDDLQWADAPSLVLLQFLANEVRPAPLFVVGAYRAGEVGRDHPLTKSLDAMSRVRDVRVITLYGLTTTAVATFLQSTLGQPPNTALVATILNETGGNPFFLAEVAYQLRQQEEQQDGIGVPERHTKLPPTVRGAIRQRLNQLSPTCNRLLTLAAVIGREFTLTRLARLNEPFAPLGASLAQDRLLTALDEAIQAQLIQPFAASGATTGRYRFIHDLVRETIYTELPTAERLRLHQQVGALLEQLHVADPDAHLAELAYHFWQAAPLGVVDKALTYTVRAAERSLHALAYEEAARTYEQALTLLTMQETVDPAQHTEVLLALGHVQTRSGESAQARQTFDRTAALARQTGATRPLAQAALGFAGDVVRPGVTDEAVIARLEEALTLLGEGESEPALQVRLLARLAMEYRYSAWRARGDALSRLALGRARQLGAATVQENEGRAALVYALNARHFAILAPDTLEERMAISLELAALAVARGDRELLFQSLPWRVADLLTVGNRQAADEAMAQANALAAEMRQPLYRWYAQVFCALQALLQGDWVAAERLAESAYAIGERVQPGGAAVYRAAQQFMIHWEQGRLAEMAAVFTDLVARFPAMPVLRCFRALAQWHAGNQAAAQTELTQLCANQAAALSWDQLWLGGVTTLAELTLLLSDRNHAALLYELLLPYAERNVMVGVPNCLGAVAAYLGSLAALLGRREAAIDHFTRGLALNQQLAIHPFLARTQVRYAAFLLPQGNASDRAQAHALLQQAQATAEALDLTALRAEITPLLATATAPTLPGLTLSGLTPREIEVLRLIAAGHPTKAMAATLVVSVPTVERHITHIYEKLGVNSRAEATAYALRQGLA
ncbi:MAG: LuxR family transcriptional regulator [Caldilinea sp. CFX5]|nr:LuxR family transcriptional regulator [Caldilinea sp. CFX5]